MKKKIIIPLWILLILSLSIFIYIDPFKKEEKVKKPIIKPHKPVTEKLSFSMITAGDALIHDGVYIDARSYKNGKLTYDFTPMFQEIKNVIEPYDLKFYNQETVIGGKDLGYSGYPNFNSPDEIGNNLIDDIGFNIVNLASNHSMDKGSVATTYSVNFWEKKENVYKVGSYSSMEKRNNIEIREVNGISYAILGYTYGTNGMPVPKGKEHLVNVWPVDLSLNNVPNDADYQNYKKTVKEDIDRLRDKVDVLMVSMHWGLEYQHVPNAYQRDAAKFLADNDVDVVIGHHTHSIQPVEYVDDTLVIYSLGNLLSAQNTTQRRIGMMAAFTVNKEVVDGKTTKIEVVEPKADLIYTYYNGYQNFQAIPFNKLTNIKLYGYKNIYEQYIKYINPKNDDRIKVGFFE